MPSVRTNRYMSDHISFKIKDGHSDIDLSWQMALARGRKPHKFPPPECKGNPLFKNMKLKTLTTLPFRYRNIIVHYFCYNTSGDTFIWLPSWQENELSPGKIPSFALSEHRCQQLMRSSPPQHRQYQPKVTYSHSANYFTGFKWIKREGGNLLIF